MTQQLGICTFHGSGTVIKVVDEISSELELGTYSWPGSFFLAAYLDELFGAEGATGAGTSRELGIAVGQFGAAPGGAKAAAVASDLARTAVKEQRSGHKKEEDAIATEARATTTVTTTTTTITGVRTQDTEKVGLGFQKTRLGNTRVVELGAGTGLPSLLLARLGARAVTLTDDSKRPAVLRACRANCDLNGISSVVRGLDWTDFRDAVALCLDPYVLGSGAEDLLILGADVFWLEERFEDLVSCVAHILRAHREKCRAFSRRRSRRSFLTAFHLRDASLSIAELLRRYGLVANVVATASDLELPVYERVVAKGGDGGVGIARGRGRDKGERAGTEAAAAEVAESMMFMKASQDTPVVLFEIAFADEMGKKKKIV